jgi:hypothetical protein
MSVNIKLLESTSNLKRVVSRNLGFELSAEKANQICACLQQGRFYFEAATPAAWEIKPLLAYYGVVAFSTAVVLTRTKQKLESLPQNHGITDVSQTNAKLDNLAVKIEETKGILHAMNDVFRLIDKLILHTNREQIKVPCPTSPSVELINKTVTLKQILGRIPGLEHIYRNTFDEEPHLIQCSQFSTRTEEGKPYVDFDIHLAEHQRIVDLESLQTSAQCLRDRFDFLKRWRPISASSSAITFANILPVQEEFNETLWRTDYGFRSNAAMGEGGETIPSEFAQGCEPVSGALTYNTSLIERLQNSHVNEMCLFFLGLFILSSLVRYRPNIWANAIARRAIGDGGPDDRALAIIEHFVDLSLSTIPGIISEAIKEPE